MISFTFFQNIEYFTSKKDQYLLIHKCACTTIREAQKDYYKDIDVLEYPLNDRVKWTVLRDPYDRFISGLSYDLVFNNYNDIQKTVEKLIEKDKLLDNVYEYINKFFRYKSRLSHIIPQSTYIVQQPIDFYVDIKDVDLFLKLNYYKTIPSKENVGNKEVYRLVKEVVDNYKQRVLDIYSMDYYMIDRLKSNNMFWQWSNGNVIDE